MDSKKVARLKRKKRVRKKIFGTADRPRLTVFRSAKYIYAQIIDDKLGQTIVSASSIEKSIRNIQKFESKIDEALYIGKIIGKKAIDNGVSKVVFDRNGYLYHGRVKAISTGAREAGLNF